MDNQNTYHKVKSPEVDASVLILVLMDNQNTLIFMGTKIIIICLNPCFNG